MKKIVSVNKSFCDVCGKEASGYSNCLMCGKEFCYECATTESIEYKHGVYVSGSDDGRYCLECDRKALGNGDKLHAAYREIRNLRNEQEGYYTNFNIRSKQAEENLKKLQKR